MLDYIIYFTHGTKGKGLGKVVIFLIILKQYNNM